jgi:hypothetical protein
MFCLIIQPQGLVDNDLFKVGKVTFAILETKLIYYIEPNIATIIDKLYFTTNMIKIEIITINKDF